MMSRGLMSRSRMPLACLRRSYCARATLGVPAHATRAAIRSRYFELAKQTHPDSNPEAPEGAFLAIQQAFEELLAEEASVGAQRAPGTAASAAARGGTRGPQQQARPPPRRPAAARPPTLGEILCQRLEEEPGAHGEVWSDILQRKLELSSSITSSLFKACAKSAGGLPAALAILREAETEHRMTAEVRTCSLVTLLALCEAEGAMDVTMELVDMIREEDRTPEVLAALSSFFSCGIHG